MSYEEFREVLAGINKIVQELPETEKTSGEGPREDPKPDGPRCKCSHKYPRRGKTDAEILSGFATACNNRKSLKDGETILVSLLFKIKDFA